VAVKILQARYEPHGVVAERFLAEARITAQLQHPGIPPVYRVNRFPDGRPFLAMKLIRGETLDALMRAASGLNVPALFEAIAQAVGYAHAREVIHRDLKPSNVMVGAFGEVQVMDWGLAKVLRTAMPKEPRAPDDDPDATATFLEPIRAASGADSDLTQAGSVLGTPSCMAPEQAAGEIHRVGKPADVFGLGAILCWMLTGRPPYEGDGADSVRRNAVRGKTEAAFARLDAASAEPELVALCKRCLSFEPSERPVDGDAVAALVAGWRRQADERARRAELERARSSVRLAEQSKRRRVWLGLAVTLLLGMLASGALAWLANRARQGEREQRELAQSRQLLAEDQSALAGAVKDFLKEDVLILADPRTQARRLRGQAVAGADLSLRDALLRAARRIDGKFADRPHVEAELRETIGRALAGIGRAEEATAQFERARLLREERSGIDSPEAVAVRFELALGLRESGRYREALPLLKRALEDHRRLLGDDHPDTLKVAGSLADSLSDSGLYPEAIELRRDVAERQRRTRGADHPETLLALASVAASHALLGQRDEALAMRLAAAEGLKRVLGADDPDTLSALFELAESQSDFKRHGEAARLLEEVIAGRRRRLGPEHPDTLSAMNSLATVWHQAGRAAEGQELLRGTLETQRRVIGPDHPNTLITMANLAGMLQLAGRKEEGGALLEEARQRSERTLGAEHPDTLRAMRNLATGYHNVARGDDAIRLFERILEVRRRRFGAEHPDTLQSLHDLGSAYSRNKRPTDAIRCHEEALTGRRRILGPAHPKSIETFKALVANLGAAGKLKESLAAKAELDRIKLGPSHPTTINSMLGNVAYLMFLGRHDEALPRVEEALEAALEAERKGEAVARTAVPTLAQHRIRIAVAKKDAAGARRVAERWDARKLSDRDSLYNAACWHALAASLLNDRPGEAEVEAQLAMKRLEGAVAAGYRDHRHLGRDADLAALRERSDFKKLVESMKPAAPR
jgi:tetratricopeptide (TPR) repeat protein